MTILLRAIFAAILLFSSLHQAGADEAELRTIIAKFASVKKFTDTQSVINELAQSADAAAVPALKALADGELNILKSDGTVVITRKEGDGFVYSDPLSGETLGTAGKSDFRKVKIKNSIRRSIGGLLSSLTLGSTDPTVRLQAAEALFSKADPDALAQLDAAIADETSGDVRERMLQARAATVLAGDNDPEAKLQAIAVVSGRGDRKALAVLNAFAANENAELVAARQAAIDRVNDALASWQAVQNIWYGLSLGSVLLLAAIGLAITFGVMGVINMAHGEMVMLGAYTTFVVQEIIRTGYPGMFDYSLAIALPLAFLVAGAVGFALERGLIRHLYGRPLETLLATWGVSLILQQAVRSIFGPTNREVGNPSWMSGAYEVGGLVITANRLWIVVFCLVVFVTLLFVLKRTRFGLQMRAVTQNRAMASSMGIRTPMVDALTFALGSGIAGIAGVALSQIDNVSPNLGQGYIIDSFMVVVFGGVGNLWGTLVGAFTLGVANKFLEPYAGAVLAKILMLVFIILFIQRRPRGLFALRGRAVET